MRLSVILGLSLLAWCCFGINVDPSSRDSLSSAARIAANDMLTFYNGNQPGGTPGIFDIPGWFWWMGGTGWDALLQYWWLTGDTQYNDLVTQAMLFQVGPDDDYMPLNQTSSEGNDDQAEWALAAMSAAEMKFPNPPSDQPQWLALAQAVFNEQTQRWDETSCNGGIRWQINLFSAGYKYKNSISNSCLFHLATRLARYTGDTTYSDWAEQIFDWMNVTGLITADFSVYDGTWTTDNCTTKETTEWTYNTGHLLAGSAYLYNITTGAVQTKWRSRVDSFINAAKSKFFDNGVLWEAACEPYESCDTDQLCFKGFLAQYMSLATLMVPDIASEIFPLLASSAAAAGTHCVGGPTGTMCDPYWTTPYNASFTPAVGAQMTALNLFNANILNPEFSLTNASLVTNNTGGTSPGNPGGGTSQQMAPGISNPTTKDKAGAALLTALFGFAGLGFSVYLVV